MINFGNQSTPFILHSLYSRIKFVKYSTQNSGILGCSSSDWNGEGVAIIISTVDTGIALSIFSCETKVKSHDC